MEFLVIIFLSKMHVVVVCQWHSPFSDQRGQAVWDNNSNTWRATLFGCEAF